MSIRSQLFLMRNRLVFGVKNNQFSLKSRLTRIVCPKLDAARNRAIDFRIVRLLLIVPWRLLERLLSLCLGRSNGVRKNKARMRKCRYKERARDEGRATQRLWSQAAYGRDSSKGESRERIKERERGKRKETGVRSRAW